MQRFFAVDDEAIRAYAFDLRAHLDEHRAEVLHMRLAGSIGERSRAFGEHCRHNRIFRTGNRCFIEEDRRSNQLDSRKIQRSFNRDPCTKFLQRKDMRVNPAPPDRIPAWRRKHCLAEASCQRPSKQNRCPHLSSKLFGHLIARNAARIDPP